VWQWWAPALWRRFTIGLRRSIAKDVGIAATNLTKLATVQYAKVSEQQARGAVHFHALIRLDGPKTDEGFAPAPAGMDAARLARHIQKAALAVRLTVPGVDEHDPHRILAFGVQVDTRPVRGRRRDDDPNRGLSAEQVAACQTEDPHQIGVRTRASSREGVELDQGQELALAPCMPGTPAPRYGWALAPTRRWSSASSVTPRRP